MMGLHRREVLKALAAVPLVVAPGLAKATVETNSNGAFPTPWNAVTPKEAADSRRVYEVFAFWCPFCRANFDSITNWGATLPSEFHFEAVPWAQKKYDLPSAFIFHAVRRSQPQKLRDFVHSAYRKVLDERSDYDRVGTFLMAAREAGLDMNALHQATKDLRLKDDAERSRAIISHYGVDETPSMVVAGRYVISASKTNGDYGMLLQLANGLVSKQLRG